MADLPALPDINILGGDVQFNLPESQFSMPMPYVVVQQSVNSATSSPVFLSPTQSNTTSQSAILYSTPQISSSELVVPPKPVLVQEQLDDIKFPKKILIKRQRALVNWNQPDQEFILVSLDIDPSGMEKLDSFLNTNVPSDPQFKAEAIKFVENVLLGRTSETQKLFNTQTNSPKSPGFLINFIF